MSGSNQLAASREAIQVTRSRNPGTAGYPFLRIKRFQRVVPARKSLKWHRSLMENLVLVWVLVLVLVSVQVKTPHQGAVPAV